MKNAAIIEKSKWFDKVQALVVEGLFTLTADFLLVEDLTKVMEEQETKTKSGLIMPKVNSYRETVHDNKTALGLVLAAGPGEILEDGTTIETAHRAGDVVILPHNTEWYDVFWEVDCMDRRIGRVRAKQVPFGSENYTRVREILSA